MRRVPVRHLCVGCGKTFVDARHPNRDCKYCSIDCFHANRLPDSPETTARRSAVQTGKRILQETRDKMCAAAEGKIRSQAHCAAISKSKRGDKNPMWGKTGAKHPRWLGGTSREPYGWEWNDELREEVRRRDGYKCQLCGVPQAECQKRLPVHHIDYNKKNSDPVNLVALCNSCNLKVNANREHWTGFFRAMVLRRDIAALSDSGKRIG